MLNILRCSKFYDNTRFIVIVIVIFIVICDFGQCFDYYWLTVPVDICNSALSGLLQKDRPVPAPWPRELRWPGRAEMQPAVVATEMQPAKL